MKERKKKRKNLPCPATEKILQKSLVILAEILYNKDRTASPETEPGGRKEV